MAKSGKKLVVAIVVLVLAIALATTATFAWFTMNQSVSVGDINMDVTSNTGGLYVSLEDGKDYAISLDSEKVLAKIKENAGVTADNGVKLELADVTAVKDETTKQLSLTKEEKVDGKNVAADATSYAQFTIYFRATDEMEVLLDLTGATGEESNKTYNSKVTSQAKDAAKKTYVKAWKDIVTADYGNEATISKGSDIIAKAENAARIAFERPLSETEKQSANGATHESKIWNPHAEDGFFKGNLAQDYRNDLLGTTTTVTEVAGDIKDRTTDVSLIKLVKAADGAYYEGQLTVTVWLEGTDGDCFNSVLSDVLSVSLQFNGKIVEAAN